MSPERYLGQNCPSERNDSLCEIYFEFNFHSWILTINSGEDSDNENWIKTKYFQKHIFIISIYQSDNEWIELNLRPKILVNCYKCYYE